MYVFIVENLVALTCHAKGGLQAPLCVLPHGQPTFNNTFYDFMTLYVGSQLIVSASAFYIHFKRRK